METKLYNIAGDQIETIQLPESIFNCEGSEGNLHTVVKAYLANQRQGTHATKTRSQVSGGGKKPFKQKGTGNARQGSSRSPLHPGGATVHGPQPRDYRLKVNKKIKSLALKLALTDRAKAGKIIVVDELSCPEYSTKSILKLLGKFETKSALLSDATVSDKLHKSTRNIYRSEAKPSMEISAFHVLAHDSLIVSKTGLNALIERLGGEAS